MTAQRTKRKRGEADAGPDRVHHRVVDLRTDALRTPTSGLCRGHGTAVVEDPAPAGTARGGVAGDRGTRVSKPRGAGREPRTTGPGRRARAGRAGGARSGQRKGTGDRRQETRLTFW